jgi:hypothetical protein
VLLGGRAELFPRPLKLLLKLRRAGLLCIRVPIFSGRPLLQANVGIRAPLRPLKGPNRQVHETSGARPLRTVLFQLVTVRPVLDFNAGVAARLSILEDAVEARPQQGTELVGHKVEHVEVWRPLAEAEVLAGPIGEVDYVLVLVDEEAGDVLHERLVVQPVHF